MFGEGLQILLFEAEDVEIRHEQRLEILPLVLVGGEARLEAGERLRDEALPVDLEQFGALLSD